jgi:AraC family transcriptional regulator of adaptative response/methylated-DNA-[protein]-cysteine methyltransferase
VAGTCARTDLAPLPSCRHKEIQLQESEFAALDPALCWGRDSVFEELVMQLDNHSIQGSGAYATDELRWAAVQARDAAAEGRFVYAVKTTGVYGRPGSSARLPRRENVEFFDSAAAAVAAGYRASRRAVLQQTMAATRRATLVAQACLLIEAEVTPPSLEQLAAGVRVSPFQLHRLFKAETGLTPKAYAAARRARRLRDELKAPATAVTAAIYAAGFNSNSRFYEAADQLLGMRARDYRAGGTGAVIRFAVGQCSLGAILVAQSQRGICAILLGDEPDALVRELQDQFPKAQLLGGDAGFERLVAQVVGFIEVPALGLNLPLDVRGTAFQQRVWQALREIPAGATVSYTQIAERIGAPSAVRAVARACGANRIAVAIPCHRVVRRDGDICGYRWGVARKRALLQREAKA